MADDLRRFCLRAVLHVAGVLPAGFLWGSGVALTVTQDHTVETVIIVILAMSGAISALVHKPVLQAVKFGRIAGLLALWCVAHRAVSCVHGLQLKKETVPLMDEVVSCLREYAIMTACICSAIAVGCPPPARLPLEEVERPYSLASNTPTLYTLDVGSNQPQDLISNPDRVDLLSNAGSLPFKHFGPASTYSGASEYSMLSLSSSDGRVDPIFAMSIWQLKMKVMTVMSDRDEDENASTRPQRELE
ncbi:hypothetical protein B0J13DRAFT_123792 [Dactylonectria estremocensis]|uniref:Uncharacterized protein n=1 Tax=Dactylonectria estremocensis TaxID=1079267 RepID=A0A9P9FFX7_9HYPO|nr:hypothetical protein B0J13DRAFT_123792 [Dactylonectria estremocensis]